jgi:hypothetical protein
MGKLCAACWFVKAAHALSVSVIVSRLGHTIPIERYTQPLDGNPMSLPIYLRAN